MVDKKFGAHPFHTDQHLPGRIFASPPEIARTAVGGHGVAVGNRRILHYTGSQQILPDHGKAFIHQPAQRRLQYIVFAVAEIALFNMLYLPVNNDCTNYKPDGNHKLRYHQPFAHIYNDGIFTYAQSTENSHGIER